MRRNSRNKIRNKKLAAERYGRRAEWLSCWYLRCKGYRIVAKRYRNAYGEIDIIACRCRTLIAVEVKARRSLAECADTVMPWKQQKIARALQGALAGYGPGHGKIAGLVQRGTSNIRFDVIWIAPWHWPTHIKDAWRP